MAALLSLLCVRSGCDCNDTVAGDPLVAPTILAHCLQPQLMCSTSGDLIAVGMKRRGLSYFQLRT